MQSQANQKGGVDESIPLKAKAVPPYTPDQSKRTGHGCFNQGQQGISISKEFKNQTNQKTKRIKESKASNGRNQDVMQCQLQKNKIPVRYAPTTARESVLCRIVRPCVTSCEGTGTRRTSRDKAYCHVTGETRLHVYFAALLDL